MQKRLKGLYAITRESKGDSQQLFNDIQAALKGGARIVQYRDKSNEKNRRQHEVEQLLSLCNRYSVPLIINDDIALAKMIGAAGVHLGKNDADLLTARNELGDQAIIGVSCYNNLKLAEEAEAIGANYVAFGSFFSSPSKPKALKADSSLLQSWGNHRTPVCAIGGITLETAPALIDSGADMLAIISGLWESTDIEKRAQSFSELFVGG